MTLYLWIHCLQSLDKTRFHCLTSWSFYSTICDGSDRLQQFLQNASDIITYCIDSHTTSRESTKCTIPTSAIINRICLPKFKHVSKYLTIHLPISIIVVLQLVITKRLQYWISFVMERLRCCCYHPYKVISLKF